MAKRSKRELTELNQNQEHETFYDILKKSEIDQRKIKERLQKYEEDLKVKALKDEEKKLFKSRLELAKYERKLNEENAAAERELNKAIMEMSLKEFQSTFEGSATEAAKKYKEAFRKEVGNELKSTIKGLTGYDSDTKTLSTKDSGLMKALSKSIDAAMDIYTKYQASINTRLIGYTDKAFKNIVDRSAKASPYYKTSEYLENINKLVSSGIATNVEQRALLETIKDELVPTFEATNATLLRLVRIQGEDTTAARMGMEGYLNKFLNSTYGNTEYLTQLFDSTTASIEEATSLLSPNMAISTEYAIQKWLGSLYSVGMSSSGINTLAQALGQLGSGNISDLVGTNAGNLIAMASKGNLATYFKNGLSEATVNLLMNSLVTYLQELNDSGNNVVRSQLARVFGLSISDLVAASNLDISDVTGTLSASGATSYLSDLMGTVNERLTMATMMSNFVENVIFTFGSQIAESPILYGLYKGASVLESIIPSGIALPTISVLGTGIDLKTSVSDIMRIIAFGGGAVQLVSDLIGGAKLGISLLNTYNSLGKGLERSAYGTGLGSGSGVSQSAYIGNTSGSDLYESSIASAEASSNEQMETAKVKAKKSQTADDIEVVVPNIYKYLIGSFDSKMSTLVTLIANKANYSVIDTYGNLMNTNMSTIIHGTTANVVANPVEEPTQLIADNISTIVTLLESVITNGTMKVSLDALGSINSTVTSTANAITNNFGYKLNY